MPGSDIISGPIWQGAPTPLIARIRSVNGSYLTQASLTAITYAVFNASGNSPSTVVASGTLTISSVVYDALQTDARWTVDSLGYNFLAVIPGTAFPLGGTLYRVEITFTDTSSQKFRVVFQPKTQAIMTTPL